MNVICHRKPQNASHARGYLLGPRGRRGPGPRNGVHFGICHLTQVEAPNCGSLGVQRVDHGSGAREGGPRSAADPANNSAGGSALCHDPPTVQDHTPARNPELTRHHGS